MRIVFEIWSIKVFWRQEHDYSNEKDIRCINDCLQVDFLSKTLLTQLQGQMGPKSKKAEDKKGESVLGVGRVLIPNRDFAVAHPESIAKKLLEKG